MRNNNKPSTKLGGGFLLYRLFIAFLLIQLLPLLIVKIKADPDEVYDEKFAAAFNACIAQYVNDELGFYEKHDEGYKSGKRSYDNVVKEIVERKTIICNDRVHHNLRSYNIVPIIGLTVFCLTPLSWLCAVLTLRLRGKYQKKKQENEELNYMKIAPVAIFVCLTIGLILFSGFSLVWYFGVNSKDIPSFAKYISFTIGVPMLFTLGILTEAFGKAFGHSGKRVHVKLVEHYTDDEGTPDTEDRQQ